MSNLAIKRSLKTGQPKMRMIAVHVASNATVTGFDQHSVECELVATGKYTLKFKYPFNLQQPVPPMAMIQCAVKNYSAIVHDAVHNFVEIHMFDETGAAAADCDFDVIILGNDGRLTY